MAALHDAALAVLEREGMKILLPEARNPYAAAGARVADDMVHIGRDIIQSALQTAPRQWRLRAANPAHDRLYAPGQLLFGPGAGCPNATDLQRGRRPGTLRDYEQTPALQQSFDVIHILGPSVEPQDVAPNLRHYAMMRAQIRRAAKPIFVYARGRAQIADSLHMIRLGLDLSDDNWASGVRACTVITTNAPRQLDNPMAEGIIAFARAGQAFIITPFCLAGAMAPVPVAGAPILQQPEALAGITLAQLARPGAPVSFGGFSSNVDMKSGAPAFGTPEPLKMQIGSGQLARHIGLPWRSASGSACNTADMQAAQETTHTLWGAMMAQATLVVHAAGWLEAGLTFGYEKFINDIRALQTLSEMGIHPGDTQGDVALDTLAKVPPAGHFFATAHTMARYDVAFYPPLVADLSDHGQSTEGGALRSDQCATAISQRVLDNFQPPAHEAEAEARLTPYIANCTAAGGAPPLD